MAILARCAEPVETRRGLPGDPGDTHSRYIEAAIGGFAFGRDAGLRIDHLLLSPSFFLERICNGAPFSSFQP